MFGTSKKKRQKPKDEAEKPFWISFADLMTSSMILFLVVMSIALIMITKPISVAQATEKNRKNEIDSLKTLICSIAKKDSVEFIWGRDAIDFGDKARFGIDSDLLSERQKINLRCFVPKILAIAREGIGKKWLKQIVIEGYTDTTGTYLYNLDLSLRRSGRVLKTLLEEDKSSRETLLNEEEKQQVRNLFLVGGYSLNNKRKTLEESRRVELRLEWYPDSIERRKSVEISKADTTFASFPVIPSSGKKK